MTKKFKKPLVFLTVFAMLMSVLMYFPAGTFGNFGLGLTARAETVLNPSSSVATAEPSGSGTSSDPYIITNKAELYWLASKTYFHAKLDADIVVNAGVLDSNGDLNSGTFDEWPGLKVSSGSFDGGNHTIKGIIVKQPTLDNQGFITGSYNDGIFQGEVKNLKIADSYIEGNNNVGGICGDNWGGIVSDCSFDGTVIGNTNVAGICGLVQLQVSNNNVEKCINTGKVSGSKRVGGIVGWADCLVKVDKCVNKGKISGTDHIGGIAGNSLQSLVKECWNEGEITGTNYVAGIVGYESSKSSLGIGIRNCYNIGKISGDDFVAGIVAMVEEVEYCYNIGEVTGNNHVYGVGTYSASMVSNCYYDQTKCPNDYSNYHYATKLDTSAFESGEVAFKLRGNGEDCWGQNLDDDSRPIDAYPIFTNGDSKLAVYYGKDDGGNDKYHNHLTGTCEYCPFIPKLPDFADGKYIIKTSNELYWFACYVNGEVVTLDNHPGASAVLEADISVNPYVLASISNPSNLSAWVPIGDDSNKFTGSFDGQGHTISGLYFNNNTANYAGLFGAVGSGSVSNVGIVDSYFNGNDYVGCIAGANEGTISGCFSYSSKVEAIGSNKGAICGSGAVNSSYQSIASSGLSDSDLYKNINAFKSGEVAYLLNGDQTKLVWGQLTGSGIPTVYTPENRVYMGRISPYYHNHASDAAYCAVCPTYLPKIPTLNESGEYEISDVYELYWFAGLVNGTFSDENANRSAKGVLTADVIVNQNLFDENGALVSANVKSYWMPIGTASNPFTGSFDGNGYSIFGLYADDGADNTGLFGVIGSGGTVCNLGVVDSFINGNDFAGGIAGRNNGEISNCFFFKGTVSASGTNVGDICGADANIIRNCYYLADSETDSIGGTTAMSESGFGSGEAAYKLNDNLTEPLWGQLIGSDKFPVHIDDANVVYYGRKNPVYHNHFSHMTYCDDCPTYLGATTPPSINSNGEYMITDIDELYWFAKYVNSTNAHANAVLMNNIVVNNGVLDENGGLINDIIPYWTPIGTASDPFTGSFDGQGFTISGLYVDNSADNVGLFGVIGTGGTVTNVGVVDTYFSANDYVGGVAGKNNGTITGCFGVSTVIAAGSNKGGISGGGTSNHSFYLSEDGSGEAKTAVQFKNGDAAYNLNENPNAPVWGQIIDRDPLPVPVTDENMVYFAQNKYHNHTGPFCTYCSVILPTMPAVENGVYQITAVSELLWFARYVNSGNTTAKAVLKNDINVNADVIAADGTVNSGTFLEITSIGTQTYPFDGSFNGDGYTISGLYFDNASASNVGLFGCVGSNASITKLRIADSYFSAYQYVGSICGNNAGNITECCAENCVVSGRNSGGICGGNSGTINYCYNTGKVSGQSSGGICANNTGTVSTCYTAAKLSGNNYGGVCGSGVCENSYYVKETAPDIRTGVGTPIALCDLTKDNILTTWGAGSQWAKTPNSISDKRLYFPYLSAIRSCDTSVTYTSRFVLNNTNTALLKYTDDLRFRFETILDVAGIGEAHAPISISPVDLQPSNFSFSHNGEPYDLGNLTFDLQSSGRLKLRINGRYAGYFDINYQAGIVDVYFTEDINVGAHTIEIAYYGTGNPMFTGNSATCTFDIMQAQPTVNTPVASVINYGDALAKSVLKDSSGNTDTAWAWLDSTIVPTVTETEQTIVSANAVDDINYDYTGIDGYDPITHLVKRNITLTIERAVPSIVVTAVPSAAIPGKTINVSAVISNPNNSALTDLPAAELTYIIGSGSEQAITDGYFVIPDDTEYGTIITIVAKTSGTANYAEASDRRTTVIVTNCTHQGKVLKYDESSHWYHCDNCGADLNRDAHSGGTATCTNKAICTLCKQEYGTVNENNHAHVAAQWSADDTGHWHECSDCHAQVDKAAHTSSGPATGERAEVCTVCDYEIKPRLGHVSTPVISPNGGTFTGTQEITITCRTQGAEIYYTTDGTLPNANSTKYSGPFTIS
ncbi:MAG: chitobiase/beta-hexosaminidase C-terminal domain-containing protein, partial [Oscillospiraceae bacterium]